MGGTMDGSSSVSSNILGGGYTMTGGNQPALGGMPAELGRMTGGVQPALGGGGLPQVTSRMQNPGFNINDVFQRVYGGRR